MEQPLGLLTLLTVLYVSYRIIRLDETIKVFLFDGFTTSFLLAFGITFFLSLPVRKLAGHDGVAESLFHYFGTVGVFGATLLYLLWAFASIFAVFFVKTGVKRKGTAVRIYVDSFLSSGFALGVSVAFASLFVSFWFLVIPLIVLFYFSLLKLKETARG